jgi:ferric iron reductase protein FhuF
MQDDTQGDGPEWSPISEVYQELQALRPQWYVEIGEPRGTGWIRGTALQTTSRGPFQVLLSQIGDKLHTADRRTIAAAFALRYGWSAGMAIAPYMLRHCVPTLTLDNVSFKFHDNTLFERVALHHPTGVMWHPTRRVSHPFVQWLPSHAALLAYLRTSLVQQAQPIVDTLSAWSRFSIKGLWGMITSSWGAQFIIICRELGTPTSGLQDIVSLFSGNDVVSQMQPHVYPVTYNQVTHLYHRRAACCRYYLLPQGHYCASCPLVSQEERIQRNQEWMKNLLEIS